MIILSVLWCLPLNLLDPAFDLISRHHEFSAASGTAKLEIHSCTDHIHGITAAGMRFFHHQNIRRPHVHCRSLLACTAFESHKYSLLYPISSNKAISSEDIFLSLYKNNKSARENPVKFHKIKECFSTIYKYYSCFALQFFFPAPFLPHCIICVV